MFAANSFGHKLPYFVPVGQVMLYGVRQEAKKQSILTLSSIIGCEIWVLLASLCLILGLETLNGTTVPKKSR